MILALAGGVGGARLSAGLAACCGADDLTVVVNTGDDFTCHGLHVSPDLDSVMYTLAGRNDSRQGWGLAGESWACMQALERLGAPTWFRLGDQDLATHLVRTERLRSGASLSQVTRELCLSYGVRHGIVPMCESPVPTRVSTDEGLLDFQDYFVRRRCAPAVREVLLDGARHARPTQSLWQHLNAPGLQAIVFCPSNPWFSIEPILALQGVREAIARRTAPAVAVSPIVGGTAVKGPLAKIMAQAGLEVSPVSIAHHYRGLIDGLVVDHRDSGCRAAIEALGIRVHLADTLMTDATRQQAVAQEVLGLARELGR